jgi:hypothetical protein
MAPEEATVGEPSAFTVSGMTDAELMERPLAPT